MVNAGHDLDQVNLGPLLRHRAKGHRFGQGQRGRITLAGRLEPQGVFFDLALELERLDLGQGRLFAGGHRVAHAVERQVAQAHAQIDLARGGLARQGIEPFAIRLDGLIEPTLHCQPIAHKLARARRERVGTRPFGRADRALDRLAIAGQSGQLGPHQRQRAAIVRVGEIGV